MFACSFVSQKQQELDDEQIDEHYRQKCLRCLRNLIKDSGALPPSFYLRNVSREGEYPISGGGFAVSTVFDNLDQISNRLNYTHIRTSGKAA
jgi:hypothetical protein